MHWLQLRRIAAFAAAACLSTAVSATALHCKELLIPVDVAAKNFALPSNFTLADLASTPALGAPPNATVKGRYTIGARYCEPVKHVADRHSTLQILIHGLTYTRDYWSGLAAPGTKQGQDRYSWIVYAAEQGYPTLSIDRLCNGISSDPDGIAACQIPLETETVHALITMARTGKLPGQGKARAFDKIVLVSHSYGSILANYLTVTHPHDLDALILSGFSFNTSNGSPGSANLGIEPAAKADPDRFGKLEPSYLTSTNRSGVRDYFYYGRFQESIVDYDFAHRGTVTLGEFASYLVGQQPAPSYCGKLFVLDGNEDKVFCAKSLASSAAGEPGDCSAGMDQIVKDYYPAASDFGFFNAPETGHCLNLHLTAQQSFKAAHRFLARSGF